MKTPEFDAGLSPDQLETLERLAKQEAGVQQRNEARVMAGLKSDGQSQATTKFIAPTAPGVTPDDPMSEAGRQIMAYYFGKMLAQEEAVRLGGGAEPVHDMRVATRRLRSALRIFEPFYVKRATRPFRKALNRLADALGEVRDLDVFRLKADKYVESLPESERAALKALLDDWQNRLVTARAALLELLDSERYTAFVAEVTAFASTPGHGARPIPADERQTPHLVRHVTARLIYEQFGIVRAYETVLQNASLDTLHALRIDAKRLRYMLEAFEEALGTEAKQVIDAAKALQDHLGDLQDARVAVAMMQAFVEGADETRSTAGVLKYMAVRENEKQQLLAAVGQTWQAFAQPDVRRALALAVSAL